MKPKHWVSIALTVVTLFAGFQEYSYTTKLVDEYLPQNLKSETKALALQLDDFVKQYSTAKKSQPKINHSKLNYGLTVYAQAGKALQLKQMNINLPSRAPQWFSQLFSVHVIQSNYIFYVDQMKKGTLFTQSSAAAVIDSSWWFFCVLTGGYLLMLAACNYLLNAQESRHKEMLNRLCISAQSVNAGKFSLIKQMRGDGLFAELVVEFNNMVNHLELKDKAAITERRVLSNATKFDDLTGFANKPSFNQALTSLLGNEGAKGYLLLLRLVSLEQVNAQLGFDEGDIYISRVANNLIKNFGSKDLKNKIFKISGRDFILVLPDFRQSTLDDWAEKFKKSLITMDNVAYKKGCASFSIIGFNHHSSLDFLLNQLDLGLSRAMNLPDNSYVVIDKDLESEGGLKQWFNIVSKIIETQKITLNKQQLKHHGENLALYNFELFTLFEHDGQAYNARDIFAAAKRFSLAPALDKVIIEKMFKFNRESVLSKARYLAKLSYDSVLDIDFYYWLKQLLSKESALAQQFVFQLPEQTITQNFAVVKQFITMLHSVDAKVCLEYEGSQYSHQLSRSIGELNIDMVKVNGHYTRRINKHRERATFVSSLVAIAHSINIPVIASQVEQSAEWDSLNNLGVDAVQGNLFGHVRPI